MGLGAEGRPSRVTGFCSWECKPCVTPASEWGRGCAPWKADLGSIRRVQETAHYMSMVTSTESPLGPHGVHPGGHLGSSPSVPLSSLLHSSSLFIPAPSLQISGPQTFWHPGLVLGKTIFPRGGGRMGSGGMAQVITAMMGNGRWSFPHSPATHLLSWAWRLGTPALDSRPLLEGQGQTFKILYCFEILAISDPSDCINGIFLLNLTVLELHFHVLLRSYLLFVCSSAKNERGQGRRRQRKNFPC